MVCANSVRLAMTIIHSFHRPERGPPQATHAAINAATARVSSVLKRHGNWIARNGPIQSQSGLAGGSMIANDSSATANQTATHARRARSAVRAVHAKAATDTTIMTAASQPWLRT